MPITEADLGESSTAAQLHAVAQAAYAVEAKLIGCTSFPPLSESLEELCESSDSFLVFWEAGVIIAALSFHRSADAVVITRLVVSPTHFRRGIATALLTELERSLAPGKRLMVSTAQANVPAVALYQRLGFTITSASNSMEGIPLVHLTRSCP